VEIKSMEKAQNTTRRASALLADWCDTAPPEIRRRYLKGFLLNAAAYAVLLIVSLSVLRVLPHGPWRFAVALAPMIPMFFLLRVYVRYLRQIDELQRQILLEGLGFAFAGTALITLGYGSLQAVGFPELSWFLVWPIMSVLWGIGHSIAARRYR
jgi:hypothetical protein